MSDSKAPSAFQFPGTLPGIVLLVWAVSFSLFKSDIPSTVFWLVFVSVSLLIVLVPSWLAGQRAKRTYLEKSGSPE